MRIRRSTLIAMSMALAAGGGYVVGVATVPQPAVAQGPDVIDLDVYTRLDAAEARLDALEQGRGTVTAPFRVVDESGAFIASIGRGAENLPELLVGDGIVLGYADGEPRVSVFAGSRVAGMHLRDGVATVYASSDGIDGFFAGSDPKHGDSVRIIHGGASVGVLGMPPGRNAGLRLYTGDTLIGALAMTSAGDGLMFTANADGSTAVTAGAIGSGVAAVDVHHGGVVRASMNTTLGSGVIGIYNGSASVAHMSETAGGGAFSATDSGGSEVFGAGFDGTSGVACIRRPNGNPFCLEPVMPLTRVE